MRPHDHFDTVAILSEPMFVGVYKPHTHRCICGRLLCRVGPKYQWVRDEHGRKRLAFAYCHKYEDPANREEIAACPQCGWQTTPTLPRPSVFCTPHR